MTRPSRRSATVMPRAVPTSTGAIAAGSVRGRAAMSQMRKGAGPYGRRGNLEKSGRRFSTYALRPSCASSLM